MREDVGLEMRQEFEDAAEVVEANTGALTPHFPKDVMEKFHATEADLKNMAARYTGLKIAGLADKAGHAVAHAARIDLRDARVLIDKTRKAETAEAQTYIKTCNAVAKYLTNIIAPTEDALDAEEAAYDALADAEKNRKQAEAAAALQKRIEALQAVGHPVNLAEVTLMTEVQFGFVLESAAEAWKAREKTRLEAEAALATQEAERKAAEEKAAQERAQAEKAERDRIAQVKAEQDAESKRLADERAAMQKEREAFDAEKRAQQQAAREEQIRKDAAEKAQAKAIQDAKEAQERAAREEQIRKDAAEKAQAKAAARPDADKIRALAKVIREIGLPKMATLPGNAAMTEIEASLKKFAAHVEGKADALSPITHKAP